MALEKVGSKVPAFSFSLFLSFFCPFQCNKAQAYPYYSLVYSIVMQNFIR